MPRRYTGVRRYGFPRPPLLPPIPTCQHGLTRCECSPPPPPPADPWMDQAVTLSWHPAAEYPILPSPPARYPDA